MEAPYSLATLPRLLDSEHGRVYAAPVVEIKGNRKRKRDEVVVGLDGDGISIYSMRTQSQALQANYASPPQTYQCCAPISVHSAGQRDTFSVVRNAPRDLSRRLVRYTEKRGQSQQYSQPVKTEFRIREGTVRAVEPIASTSLAIASPRALIAYEDGAVICIDETMTSSMTQRVLQDDEGNSLVEHVAFLDLKAAEQGFLQNRDDLLATLRSKNGSLETRLLGCFLLQRDKAYTLRLCIVEISGFTLTHLDDISLPSINLRTVTSWSLAASGRLFCLADGEITAFELSSLSPQITTKIKDRRGAIVSFAVLSGTVPKIAALSDNRLTIYDSKYGSDQGSILLDEAKLPSVASKKRKRSDLITFPPDLCFFPEVNTIAIVSDHIAGVQLKLTGRSKASSLSDVIGNGIVKHLVISEDKLRTDDRKWYTTVEDIISRSDSAALEDAVLQAFFNDDPDMSDELWPVEYLSLDLGPARYRKALVVLERLFSPVQAAFDTPARLHLRLVSRNVLRWLAVTGLLTAEKLSIVLAADITSAQLANALIDPSFKVLQDILQLQVSLPPAFVVELLRLLIRSLDTSPAASVLAVDTYMTNGDAEEAQIEAESRHAERELSTALTTLATGLETRSEAMRLVFDRLNAMPHKTLAKQLRQGLEQQDLLFFIHLLRLELADAGWTARYVDQFGDQAEQDESAPSDHAITSISNLLISAVDAIGLTGWLIGNDEENYGLIDALRAEVSASVEGAYEAHTLHSQLGELDRFARLQSVRTQPELNTDVIEVLSGNAADDVAMPVGGRSSLVDARENKRALKAAGGMTGLYQLERIRV